jgi:hypothetical protein
MRNHDLHTFQLTKATLLWLLFLLSSLSSFSQTTNISGIVNSYYPVTGVDLVKDAVELGNTFGLNQGDRVLLIQMKGASINTTNTVAFGDTTSLNNAGNYQMFTICMISNDSAYFVQNIANNYTPATGRVQLVKFGDYVNANVTDTLRASPWSNVLGTGGVIAIWVDGDLTLNRPITADRAGFAGGAFFDSGDGCTSSLNAYAYNATVGTGSTQNGAYKGEAVADPPAAMNGGRGAPANGGGGGNNHNNGGGGGGNLTAGGLGGGNSSTTGCTGNWRGIGGKALSSWGGNKIFMGGGGGAGHNNNAVPVLPFISAGGNGGGIIFIHANNIIGNGHAISSDGGIGGNTTSDGAGGAGAGGTIIMDVTTGYSNITIRANGGTGGNSNDGGNIRRCYGAGGGGSGGAIYFNGATPSGGGITVTTTAGPAGVEFGGDVNCGVQVPPVAGNAGLIINSYTFRGASFSLASHCSTVLPVRLTFFKATLNQKKVALQWNITSPEEVDHFTVEKLDINNQWIALTSMPANELQRDYTVTDHYPLPGYNSYRLKVTQKSTAVFYSLIRRVYIESENDQFTVYPNPAHDKIFIKANYNGFIDLKLFDVSGKAVMTSRSRMNIIGEIDLPALPAGVYILHINNTIRKLHIK